MARRGFASMDPAKQRELASKGGKAAHAQGVGHEWNSDTARAAGRKGGSAAARKAAGKRAAAEEEDTERRAETIG